MAQTFMAKAQDCEVTDNYRKYYGQLIGSVIENVVLVGDEYGSPIPILIVRGFDKQLRQVEVWSDPEGNGTGHLDISPYPSQDDTTE